MDSVVARSKTQEAQEQLAAATAANGESLNRIEASLVKIRAALVARPNPPQQAKGK